MLVFVGIFFHARIYYKDCTVKLRNFQIRLGYASPYLAEILLLSLCLACAQPNYFESSSTHILYEPVNSELRLAVLNFLRIFSLNCS